MTEIGLRVPPSGIAYTLDEALARRGRGRLPGDRAARVHPRRRRHRHRARSAARCCAIADARPRGEPDLGDPDRAQSVVGWKEFELEVMRDHADNVVVICSIENVDPMGVHTGESITVAPAQTLTDVEYQRMRDAAFACIRRIGVETGGSNVQFAVEPAHRRAGHHRDEPARVAVERAREQGDRVPDREDRGQARGRLPARRGAQRHHARDARVVRADDRLRRHQDPALGVREAARARRRCSARRCSRSARSWRSGARSPSRCRRRCARSRPAGSGSTAIRPSASSTRSATTSSCSRPRFRRPSASSRSRPRCGSSCRSSALHEVTGIDPWFLDQILQIVEERDRLARARLRRR